MGPYKDTDAGTSVITTRYLMYLPPKFVALALLQPSFTRRQVWTILGHAIHQDALAADPFTSLEA